MESNLLNFGNIFDSLQPCDTSSKTSTKKEPSYESQKHVPSSPRRSAQFHAGRKRNLNPRGAGDGDGQVIPSVLDSCSTDIAFEPARRPAGTHQTPRRRLGSVPHPDRRRRAHRRLLPTPARAALLRAGRSRWAALRVSRLEVCAQRQVYRYAQYTGGATIHG